MTAKYYVITMNFVLFSGILAVAITTAAGFGFTVAVAQMADNATMGNMTGGNMTMGGGNSTDASGGISGIGDDPFT
jgi:hypothetical protein